MRTIRELSKGDRLVLQVNSINNNLTGNPIIALGGPVPPNQRTVDLAYIRLNSLGEGMVKTFDECFYERLKTDRDELQGEAVAAGLEQAEKVYRKLADLELTTRRALFNTTSITSIIRNWSVKEIAEKIVNLFTKESPYGSMWEPKLGDVCKDMQTNSTFCVTAVEGDEVFGIEPSCKPHATTKSCITYTGLTYDSIDCFLRKTGSARLQAFDSGEEDEV